MLSSGGYQQCQLGDHASGDAVLAPEGTGDGRADPSVRRTDVSGNSHFIEWLSSGGYRDVVFGRTGDKYVPDDIDGDGLADLLVMRVDAVSKIDHWFGLRSSGGYDQVDWGNGGDALLPGDFTGDGRSDIAVVRPGVPFTWFAR